MVLRTGLRATCSRSEHCHTAPWDGELLPQSWSVPSVVDGLRAAVNVVDLGLPRGAAEVRELGPLRGGAWVEKGSPGPAVHAIPGGAVLDPLVPRM